MIERVEETGTQSPLWLDWVFSNTQSGLLLLNSNCKVVLVNKWLLARAGMRKEQVQGQDLWAVFPVLRDTQFERVLQRSMQTGFPSLLSQTLHPAPFPLHAPAGPEGRVQPLRQSIQIVPMGPADAKLAGERFTLVQVSDVTSTVVRENLLRAQTEKMSQMAMYDTLTGLGNRRAFDDWLVSETRASDRTGGSMGLMFIDIDHFKLYNDHYGHPAGDVCLRKVADAIRAVCLRPRDKVARYGGEELVVILPDTDLAGACRVGAQVLESVRNLALPHATSPVAAVVTLSVGVAAYAKNETRDPEALLREADGALYVAKRTGRNRVCFHGEEVTPA